MPFPKGKSGNVSADKMRKAQQLRELLLPHVQETLDQLLKCMRQGDGTSLSQLPAIKEILSRVYGAPVSAIELTGGENGSPINIIIKDA